MTGTTVTYFGASDTQQSARAQSSTTVVSEAKMFQSVCGRMGGGIICSVWFLLCGLVCFTGNEVSGYTPIERSMPLMLPEQMRLYAPISCLQGHAKVDPTLLSILRLSLGVQTTPTAYEATGCDRPLLGRFETNSCMWKKYDFLRMLFIQGHRLKLLGSSRESAFECFYHARVMLWNMETCSPSVSSESVGVDSYV
jgi:hypothetical protein